MSRQEERGVGTMLGLPSEQLPPNQPNVLSGQQVQSLQQAHAAALAGIKRDIELRKWAVDQACGLAGSENCTTADKDPVAVARSIHAFLVEGAAEKAE
jgi:hypothetical protein